MEQDSIFDNLKRKQVYRAFGMTILAILLLNSLNLVIEIYKLEIGAQIEISYANGYFILNGNTIGFNPFANLFGIIILFLIFLKIIPEATTKS